MNWSKRRTLVAGMALIAVTNAVVLAGAAYNRGGEPEAQLRLTEREFHRPYSWGFRAENSGLALRLSWRVPRAADELYDYGYGGGRAAWLNRAKLAELGFDVSVAGHDAAAERHYDRQLDREVLVVLEIDGPARQAALKRAEARAAAPTASRPQQDELRNEQERYSRLFAIDAGLDHAALRSKYPDRARHAIVRGKVGIAMWARRANDQDQIGGHVSELSVSELNVPLELRDTLDKTPHYSAGPPGDPRQGYEAVVAFGRRLEPWLVSVTPRTRP